MYIPSFAISESEIREVVIMKLADQVLFSMDYDKKQEVMRLVKTQIEGLDAHEITKQATAFMIAKVMGEIK